MAEIKPITQNNTPSVFTTDAAFSEINKANNTLNEVLNTQGKYYQENPLFYRPGETLESYYSRTQPELRGSVVPVEEKIPKKEIKTEKIPVTETKPAKFIEGTDIVSTGNVEADKAIRTHYESVQADKVAIDDIRTQIKNIKSWTYENPANQAVIDGISLEYDNVIRKQEELNKAVLAGMTKAGVLAGRSRYAPTIETSNINSVMQSGLDKISELQRAKAAAIAKAKQASNESDLANLYKEMQLYQDSSKSETEAITELQKQIKDVAAEARQSMKDALETAKLSSEMTLKEAQQSAYSAFSYLESKYKDIDFTPEQAWSDIQEYANVKGLDPDYLFNEVEKLKQERETKYAAGLAGEYQFALKHGYKGSFPDYQKFKEKIKETSPKLKEKTETEIYKERQTTAFNAADSEFQNNLDKRGYISWELYKTNRDDYSSLVGNVKEFDDRFSYLLKDSDRIKHGIK